jgi:hypothetical protein
MSPEMPDDSWELMGSVRPFVGLRIYAAKAHDPMLGMTVDQFEAPPLGNDVWLAK